MTDERDPRHEPTHSPAPSASRPDQPSGKRRMTLIASVLVLGVLSRNKPQHLKPYGGREGAEMHVHAVIEEHALIKRPAASGEEIRIYVCIRHT